MPFGCHDIDFLDDEDAVFAADSCSSSHHLQNDNHHVLLQRAFMPPKKNCDAVQYSYSMLDPQSLVMLAAMLPTRRLPVSKPTSIRHRSSFSVAPEKPASVPSPDEQRTSLSDLRSHYWELLKQAGFREPQREVTLLSKVTEGVKQKTLSKEESDLKARLASILGKKHDAFPHPLAILMCPLHFFSYWTWLLWLAGFYDL